MSTENDIKKGLDRLLGSLNLAHAATLTRSGRDQEALQIVSRNLEAEAEIIFKEAARFFDFKDALAKLASQPEYRESIHKQLRDEDRDVFMRELEPVRSLRALFKTRRAGADYDPQHAAAGAAYAFNQFNFRKMGWGPEFYEYGRPVTHRFQGGDRIAQQAAIDIVVAGGGDPNNMIAPRPLTHTVQNLKIAVRGGIGAERILRAIEAYAQQSQSDAADLTVAQMGIASAIDKAKNNPYLYEALAEILNNPASQRGATFYSRVDSASIAVANDIFATMGLPSPSISQRSTGMSPPEAGRSDGLLTLMDRTKQHASTELALRTTIRPACGPQR